eukprot:985224-Amorphochlora_amoeboformis.AAC.1
MKKRGCGNLEIKHANIRTSKKETSHFLTRHKTVVENSTADGPTRFKEKKSGLPIALGSQYGLRLGLGLVWVRDRVKVKLPMAVIHSHTVRLPCGLGVGDGLGRRVRATG